MRASGADGPPVDRRGVRLREAILARFGTEEQFIAAVREKFGRAPDRTITTDFMYALVHDPDRWPNLPRLETLAFGAGWTVEQVVEELGRGERPVPWTYFGDLPRLRTLLRANLTRIEPTMVPDVGPEMRVPVTLTCQAEPEATGPLHAMLVGGLLEPSVRVARASPPTRLTARVGDIENAAYPRIPARALLRVDRADTAVSPERFFLIEHPHGLSCCRTEAVDGRVVLLPEAGSGYPRLEWRPEEVTVHGHIVAMAGHVGRWSPPLRWMPEPPLRGAKAAKFLRYGTSPHPAKTLVRASWQRQGGSYGHHDRLAWRRLKLLGRNGRQPRSTLRPYVEDVDRPPPFPDFETLFGLCASFDVDYQDLLQAFGLSSDVFARRTPGEEVPPSDAIERLRTHAFGAYLEGLGWDLPWLCTLFAMVDKARVYHLGQLHAGWSPLLRPGCFVVVDPERQAVPPAGPRRTRLVRRDWERPMFLLQTPSRPHLLCGYCERDGNRLHVLPHPDDPSQEPQEFTLDLDVELIGQVTHVATLLP